MATYNEQLQKVWHQYEADTGQKPSTTREVVEWGIERGLLKAPRIDPFAKLSEDMATALRAEYRVDRFGRKYRVNHAVRITSAGTQLTLWANLETAPRHHMDRAFSQRRRQVVDDCFQLKTDVDVYNDSNPRQIPIKLVLNFTDDVAELQTVKYDKVG